MIVYRITHAAYSKALVASGNPARWNSRDIKMIYTAESRALACLENVVHRNTRGLQQNFRTLQIEIPNSIFISTLNRKDLPTNWQHFKNMPLTQQIGDKWISENKSAILQIPSVIVPEEYNYLINPLHPDFKSIEIKKVEVFTFDERLVR